MLSRTTAAFNEPPARPEFSGELRASKPRLYGSSSRPARRLRSDFFSFLNRHIEMSGVKRSVFFIALLLAVFMSKANAQTDLAITETASAPVVAAGTNVTFTIVVTNNGPNSASAIFYENIPANTTFQAIGALPTGWSCTTPAVGGTSPVTCTNAAFANGGSSTFTLTLQINAGTAAETEIRNIVSTTSNSTTESSPSNNTAVSNVLVGIAGDADLQLSLSAAPNPVFVSSPLSYTIVVKNLGVAAAPSTQVTDTLPSQVTYVSSSSSLGSCSQATGVVTCNVGTLAAAATVTITINVTAPGTAVSLTDSASTTSSATDPFMSNNSASLMTFVQPSVCAMPGNDGNGGTLTGAVNTYFPPSAATTLAAGSKSVTLGAAANASTQGIASGDLLMFMQMQDAAINSTNTGAYGDGTPGDPATGSTNLNSSGRYEFVTATSAITSTGGAVQFKGAGPSGGLINNYTQAAYSAGVQGQRTFQVIRVPQYQSATFSATLAPLAWNGSVGGVLVIDVAGQLTLGGPVKADSLGFRGGAGRKLAGGTGAATDYVTLATAGLNGSKGEGIAGTPRYLPNLGFTAVTDTAVEGLPNGSYARGAPGNAGGGGTDADPARNDENSGGGGGGNGSDGGLGGYAWNTASSGNGFGGNAFPGSISNLIMGGAGGAGTSNDGTADPANSNPAAINSSGAAGGGIIIVHAGVVVGTGTITANGQTALNVLNDGAGGGGAGGSIQFLAFTGGITGATLNANGGNGGNTWLAQTSPAYPGNRHGPGGGGGGGVILTSSPPAAAAVTPGADGVSTTVHDPYGSTPGNGNGINTNLGPAGFTQIPGVRSGAECAVADLAVTNSGTPDPVVPGANITYTQTVTNNGPQSAASVTFSEAIPTNTTFVSFTQPVSPVWTCNTPAVGATGNITCTVPSNDLGVTSNFSLVVKVGAGTPSGTTISDTDTVSSGVSDNNVSNNSATVNTLVASPSSADIAVTDSASPATVATGGNITYTQTFTNNGPATATTDSFVETVPPNTTFQSFPTPSGWNCSIPAVNSSGGTISCTIASVNAGVVANFTLTVKVNNGVASGTVITDTVMGSSALTDPDPQNNSATAKVTVAQPTQSDVSISKSVTPNPVLAGNNLTYNLTIANAGPADASTVSVSDALPANTTFVSAGANPTGFTCTTPTAGMTGTITCTNSTFTAGSSVTYTFVLNVTAGTAPGTVISNTASITTTTSDPNSSNNSSTAVTSTVASPTQADLSITKTASPEPVYQNDTLTYTITVSNNGPAPATSVVVTDPLPNGIYYQSSSSTQGTCSQVSSNVTCNLGTLSNGQSVVVTIAGSATGFSSMSLSTNTATVSSATSDPDSSNNSATVSSTIATANAVQITSFQARAQSNGPVILVWHTSEEIDNLGFHIYREVGGVRTRVDNSLITGSALLFRGGHPTHRAKTYRWLDPKGTIDSTYWLEDIDLQGRTTLHGPISAEPTVDDKSPNQNADQNAAAQSIVMLNRGTTSSSSGQPDFGQPDFGQPEGSQLAVDAVGHPVNRASLSGFPAIQISVTHQGWYSVTAADLFAAGLDPTTDSTLLQLYAEGIEQPIRIVNPSSGPLQGGSAIEFYGSGIDTPFSGTRVYWLVTGSHPGKRIPAISSGGGARETVSSFSSTAQREDRTVYFAALLNGENSDNFFGTVISSTPIDQELDLTHKDPASDLVARLTLRLQGVTDGQLHQVSVGFNGASIGEMTLLGQANASQTFDVESALLRDGKNTVTLAGLNGENDLSVVQYIRLQYARTFVADGNWLKAQAPAGAIVNATGFTADKILVFDVTDPLNVSQLIGETRADGSRFAVKFSLPGASTGTRSILAFTPDAVSSPNRLAFHAPSNLSSSTSGADIVIITHPRFLNELTPLRKWRESQGHVVNIVTTDQIFDAFNYGERSPHAIRDFLRMASTSWKRKPAAILLVGDASLDPRNYLGQGDFDFVPTRIIETLPLKTASDDWFTDFGSSGFAAIPVGRLPVRTNAEASLVISKIIDYEKGTYKGTWNSQAILIADQNVFGNFTGAALLAQQELPTSMRSSTILANGTDPATTRGNILTALNAGSLIVNYNGHGSNEQWSFENLLDDSSAATLTNGNQLPVFLLMDCLNGFFQDVYTQSLAESLLLAPQGGAVAVWASSGLTSGAPQAQMDQALLRYLTLHPKTPIGEAIRHSKMQISSKDVRRTWVLFGDPAMRIQFPEAQIVH